MTITKINAMAAAMAAAILSGCVRVEVHVNSHNVAAMAQPVAEQHNGDWLAIPIIAAHAAILLFFAWRYSRENWTY